MSKSKRKDEYRERAIAFNARLIRDERAANCRRYVNVKARELSEAASRSHAEQLRRTRDEAK